MTRFVIPVAEFVLSAYCDWNVHKIAEVDPHQASETRFRIRDFVEVGQIFAIDAQTVAGTSLEFFVIYFAKSKMTIS